MRIVQLLTQDRGGPVDHAVDVAAALADRGHESHLIGPAGPYAARLDGTGARFHPVAMTHRADLAGARRLGTVLAGLRPDVLHLQDRRAGLVGRIWAGRRGVPAVYTLHGVPDSLADLVPGNVAVVERRRGDRLAYLTAERQLARTPRSLVVTPSAAVTCYARREVGIAHQRVVTVPNGVEGRWWRHERPARVAGEPLVVWAGVMAPVKRVESLVRAVAAVPGLRLRLVGDGPRRAAIEAVAAEVGLGPRLEITGFLADPLPAMADADLFALPSAAEACPIALLQAMALGLPVVAARVGGVPELVRDDVDGVLVDDGPSLTAALRTLAAESQRRSELGGAARARVRERYTVDACADRLLAVYGRVAS